jgi:AcrR family transcriptional regulator
VAEGGYGDAVHIDTDLAVDRLVAAGLHEMAREGWAAASVERIDARAGVPADSGVSYHFGSREGLLFEITARGMGALEPLHREAAEGLSAESSVTEHIDAMARPFLDGLRHPVMRDFLRLSGQLGEFFGPTGVPEITVMAGTTLVGMHGELVDRVSAELGAERARSRVRSMELFLASSASTRAAMLTRWVEQTGESDVDEAARALGHRAHDEFVDDLVLQLVGGVLAVRV